MAFFFTNCHSQNSAFSGEEISFEDLQHYPYSLTSEKFLMIDNQDKMDAVYKIIFQKNPGNRFPPIPTVDNDEMYLILKPSLKDANNVLIKKISVSNEGELNVDVEPSDDPQQPSNNRIPPNIIVKLLKKIEIKKVTFTYQ